MAKPNTTFLANITSNDGLNSGNASGGVGTNSSNWLVIDLVNDQLMFLDSQQNDGDSRAGNLYSPIIPASGSIEVPKTFIDDFSAEILEQIPLAGSNRGGQSGGDRQGVFCIYFDGPTAGIPTLEAWNDNTHAAANHAFFGGGTPANSTLLAVSTTAGAPGAADWAGTPLSGTDSRINLDAAALAAAKNLYFNIRQSLPSTFQPASLTAGVLTLRYLYN